MVDPRIIKEWLDKADEDFGFADSNLQEDSTFYAQICFHFHQAAEKYLKTSYIDTRYPVLANQLYKGKSFKSQRICQKDWRDNKRIIKKGWLCLTNSFSTALSLAIFMPL